MKISGSMDALHASRIQRLNAAGQDGIVKAIEKQMSSVQKQLKSLAANQEMSRQEKELAKKELEKSLQSLSDQLNRRKEELEARQNTRSRSDVAREDAVEELLLEEDFLQGVLNADSSIKQVSAARVALMKMRARVRSLETEIRLDGARGIPTAKKEEMLSSIRSKMMDISFKLNGGREKRQSQAGESALDRYLAIRGREGEDAKDRVIIRLETRKPLKVTKIRHQKDGRLVNIRL